MKDLTLTLAKALLIRAAKQGRLYFDWQDVETGAPEINPKRPYGNSYVPGDVKEILDLPISDEEAMRIHLKTADALLDIVKNYQVYEEEC